jgi:hypothetical protein
MANVQLTSNTSVITVDQANANITVSSSLSNVVVAAIKNPSAVEQIKNNGNQNGNVTLDLDLGTIQSLTADGNITGISLNNIVAGQTCTILITQDSLGGRYLDTTTFSSNWTLWEFVNDFTTLDTTANNWSVINLFYDGNKYYASLVVDTIVGIPNSDLTNSNIIINNTTTSTNKTLELGANTTLSSDAITEGSTNVFYTDARSRTALSASTISASGGGTFGYEPSTGLMRFAPADLSGTIGLGNLSVTQASASGGGSLSYNNGTGVFTYTPPDLTAYGLTNAQAQAYIQSNGLTMTADITSNSLISTTGNITTTGNLSSTGNLSTTGLLNVGSSAAQTHNFTGNLNVTGNIEVSGNLNYRNVEDLYVRDQTITLNANATTNSQVDIISNRPESTYNAKLIWDEQQDKWKFDNGDSIEHDMLTNSAARALVSVTSNTPSGNGSLTYDNTSGVFTFTPADASGGGGGGISNADAQAFIQSSGLTMTANISAGSLTIDATDSGTLKFVEDSQLDILEAHSYGTQANTNVFNYFAAGGTESSPARIGNDDRVYIEKFTAHDGTNFSTQPNLGMHVFYDRDTATIDQYDVPLAYEWFVNPTAGGYSTSYTATAYYGSGNTTTNDQVDLGTLLPNVHEDGDAIVLDNTTNSNLTFLNGNTYYTKFISGTIYELYTNSGLSSPVQSGLGSEAPTGLTGTITPGTFESSVLKITSDRRVVFNNTGTRRFGNNRGLASVEADGTFHSQQGFSGNNSITTTAGSISGPTLTDTVLSINSGAISSATTGTFSGQVQAGTFTDGTLSINAGSISSAVNIGASGTIETNGLIKSYGGNIETTGNVVGGFIHGDGSQLTNLPGGGAGISNAQAQSFIQSSGLTMTADITSSNLIKTTGNLQVNPDTTVGGLKGLTFDSATNRLGLGTTTPETAIHIVSDGDIDSQIYMDEYSTSSSANDIRMRRAEGTLAAPRFMNSGDHIGQWYHYPWRENADPTANAAFSDLYGGSFASTGGVEISSFTDGDYIVNDITVDTIENQAGAGDGDLLKFTDRSIRFNDGTMFVLTGTTNSGLASLNGQAFYVDQGGGSTSSTYELYYDEARTNPVKVASGVQTATDMIAKVVSTAQPVGLEIIINENKVDRYSERRITKWRANGTMEFGATSTDDGTGAAASITPQGVFTTSGNITSTANVSGLNILGNGSNLTGIDLFKTISVSGQSDVVADTISDTLTLAAGSGMTITTDAGTDTITFASSGGGGGSYGNAEVQTYLASGNNAGNISTKGNVIVAKHTGTVVSTIGSYFGSGNTLGNDQIQPSTDPQWSDATAIVLSGTTNSNLTFLNGNTYYTKSAGAGAYEIYTDSGLTTPVQSGLGSESPTGLVASYPGDVESTLNVAGDVFTTGNLELSSANVLTTITEYQGNATTGTGDKIFIGSDQGWYNGQYVTFQGATDASLTFLNGNTYQVATGSGSGTTWNLYSNYQNFTKLETAVGTISNPSGPTLVDHRTPNDTSATIYGDLIVNANSVLKVNAIESFFPNQVIELTGLRVNDFKGNDPINPPSYTNTQLATLQQPFPGGYIFVTGDRAVDGEGVPAYWSGTQWKYFSDNANVSYT